VLAPRAIPFIFGDQWEASASIAQLLGFMVVPFTLNRFAGPALATLGHSGLLAKIAGLQLALTVVMTLAAAPYGLLAIAAAYVARAYLVLPIQMWAFKKYSGLGYGELMRAVALPLLTSLFMAAALLALDRFVGARFGSGAVYLLVMVSAGVASYAAALLLFARRFVAQQIRDFKRLLPGASTRLSRAGAA
jgi:O-antigen/teichoic acid export membrane protein